MNAMRKRNGSTSLSSCITRRGKTSKIMNLSNISRMFFTIAGAIATALSPTLPYIALCTVAILADCITAFLLARRVKKQHPKKSTKNSGKFKSSHFGRVILTLVEVYALLIFAYYLHIYITESLPFDVLKISAGAVVFWQGWSILENVSSCNNARWAKVLQTIMIDKTERHFEIDLSDLKKRSKKE